MVKRGKDDKQSPTARGDTVPSAVYEQEQAEKSLQELMNDLSQYEESDMNRRDEIETQEQPQIQTYGPDCQTGFDVSADLLASVDTRVRCGECLSIFDALANLRQSIHPEANENGLTENELTNEQGEGADADANHDLPDNRLNNGATTEIDGEYGSLDTTYSDFDLFSGEAELPEVPYFDKTQATDQMAFDDLDGDETLSETLANPLSDAPGSDLLINDPAIDSSRSIETSRDSLPAAANTAQPDTAPPNTAQPNTAQPNAVGADVDYLTDDVPRDPLRFNYREPTGGLTDREVQEPSDVRRDERDIGAATEQQKKSARSSSNVWLKRSLLALLLLVMALGLYGYRYRSELLLEPAYRPMLQTVCATLGCTLPPLVDLDALKVVKRTVYSHPTIDNALVIDLAFINEAAFGQPYPILEIRLTNRNGGLVTKNNVAPAEYLERWQADELLSSGERLDVNLTVEDPGQTATSFELIFR